MISSLNTNSGIGDTSWDETTGNASTIPGRYLVNINYPEPGLFLGSQDSVFKVIGNDFTEIFVDIKFCSDPNAFNCRKKGVLPVTIFGTEDFDVLTIDPDSLQLCLEDLSDCTGAPRNYYDADRGDPTQDIGTDACTSEEGADLANPDGFLDLDVRFEATEVQAMLESFCGMHKGTVSPPLIVTGSTYDGILIRSVPFPDVGIDQLLKVNK